MVVVDADDARREQCARRRVGGGGWSSKRLGIGKYDALGRVYYGTPGPTKAVVGGAAMTGGAYLNEELEGER